MSAQLESAAGPQNGSVSLPTAFSPALKCTLLIALVGPALTFVALPAALPQIASYFGGGDRGQWIAQQIQTLPFLGLAVGGLLAGPAIGFLGHRALLIVAAALYCAAGLIGLLATQSGLLLPGCGLLGLMASLITCNLVTLTGVMLSTGQQTRMLGFQTAISDFSTVAGAIGGALLAQFYGWHGPFVLYVGYGAIMLILALSLPARSIPPPVRESASLAKLAASGWPTYVAAAAIFVLVGTQTSQLPFLLAAKGFSNPAIRSLVLTCSTLAAMAGAITYGLGHARIGTPAERIAAIACALCGFLGLSLWSGSLVWACIWALAIGFGIGITVPSLFATALRRASPNHRGHSIGLLNTAIFLGSFLSPLICTPLVAIDGYAGLFRFAALVLLVLGGVSLAWDRLTRQRESTSGR